MSKQQIEDKEKRPEKGTMEWWDWKMKQIDKGVKEVKIPRESSLAKLI